MDTAALYCCVRNLCKRTKYTAWLIMFFVSTACCTERHNFVLNTRSLDEYSNCDLTCSTEPRKVLCGSDGRTYASHCEMDKKVCEGHPVQLKHYGECPANSNRCHMDRLNAQEMAQKPTAGVFIPDCEPDGSYASVQCHVGTGYCWCVTRNGRPIPGSSARFERPHCAHYLNINSHKRSSRGRKARRSCGIEDRQIFNKNMVYIFGSEYNRTQESRIASSDDDPLDLRIVGWKFSQLDADQNSALNKSELRDLRRMVKKIIRPRPCARTFAQYCDLDQNKNITREEWAVCLGVTTSASSNSFASAGQAPANSIQAATATATAPPTIPAFTRKSVLGKELLHMFTRNPTANRLTASLKSKLGNLEGGLGGIDFLQEVVPTNSSARKRDPSKKKKPNCASERSKVLLNKRRNPSATYVPECDAAGNYAKVQCHAATGFCWCVNPENGKPISQTSRLNARPDCNLQRPLRGCPGQRKENFITNLTSHLIQEMSSSLNQNQSKSIDTLYTRNDALRWKFQNLDANGNGVLERGEWRPFKEHMLSHEGLKKCGRGYMRHCDTDDNKRISVEEWLRCASTPAQNERRTSIHIKRLGPNPLEKYLKPD